jgi:hypothetical protein
MRRRGATGALVLGLLALWFGVLAPFAIVASARALRRGSPGAMAALICSLIALATMLGGLAYWLVAS